MSTTGECSNPEDMFYLITQSGYAPIIEYCGGTEIGGGYIAGTVSLWYDIDIVRPVCGSVSLGFRQAVNSDNG